MEFDEAESYYARVVREYLDDPRVTTDRAVARFVEPIRATCLDGGDAGGVLWAAWQPVIDAATERPDRQERLVDLLVGISAQGPLVRETDGQVCLVRGSMVVFTDLPCFGARMREQIDVAAGGPAGHDALLEENFVSFAARLTAAGIDFTRFAVWTYRECVAQEPADLTAFRIWHRLGGAALVEGLHRHVTEDAPLLQPARAASTEAREAREALQAIAGFDREGR